MRHSFDDIVHGRATLMVEEIQETSDHEPAVLAVDRVDRFAAAFRFGLWPRGEWYGDALYAIREADGSWRDLGSGGSHGDDWPAPWRPPPGGWSGNPVLLLGTARQDVEDENDEPVDLTIAYGFVAPGVVSLKIVNQQWTRRVAIASPVGAFAIVHVGSAEFDIEAEDSAGTTIASRRIVT